MNKKLFLLILIPAVLLIGTYVFPRYYLERAVARDQKEIARATNQTDSASANNLHH